MMKYIFNEEKVFDIVVIGWVCIDLNVVEYNCLMEEMMIFLKYVGGLFVNIVIGSVKFGLKVGFIGKILDDQYGRFIEFYMRKIGVDIMQMIVD